MTITEVLAAHPFDAFTGTCRGCGARFAGREHEKWAAHVAEAISAAGLAVIELPDPADLHRMGFRVKPHLIVDEVADTSYLPEDARRHAAELLAAANAAEQVHP